MATCPQFAIESPAHIKATSGLGRMLPSQLCVWESGLIAFRGYFDGSTSTPSGKKLWKESDFIALAGVAGGDEVMGQLESDWTAMRLDDRFRPSAPYIHMKQLRSESEKSPFSELNGWNRERRLRLVQDSVEVIASMDSERSRLFACGVDARAARDLTASGIDIASPVRICNHFCSSYSLRWFAQDYSEPIISEAHFYFDWSEPFQADFEKLRLYNQRSLTEVSGNRETWSLVKSIGKVSQGTTPALQVADMLAWGTTRVMASRKDAFLAPIAVEMKRRKPSSWSYWYKENLPQAVVPH